MNLYTLKNANGIQVQLMDYGATITSIRVPDRNGQMADVVLGFDSLADYEQPENPFFGATIGRYANRIAGGRFTLDGERYRLPLTDDSNTMHGGPRGFDKRVWTAEPFQTDSTSGVLFTRTSPDGEEGFPGTVQASVTFTLTDDGALVMDYQATTDAPTVVNLTNHAYFNMAGEGSGDILGHVVQINASHFTPVDSTLIPTGEVRSVEGTPFDFRTPTPVGARIDADDEQMRRGHGYDHNFVLDHAPDSLVLAARVVEPASGRVLEVLTTEPGIQFYSGNWLNGKLIGKDGHVYGRRTGFALEAEHYPDSPNHPEFPSTTLRPGQTFHSRTVYRFSTSD